MAKISIKYVLPTSIWKYFPADFAGLEISRDFAEIPEFRGSATARNIRSPVLRNVVLIPTVISLLRAFKFLTFIIPRNASYVLLVKYHFHKNNMAFFSINYFSCGILVRKCQSDCFN